MEERRAAARQSLVALLAKRKLVRHSSSCKSGEAEVNDKIAVALGAADWPPQFEVVVAGAESSPALTISRALRDIQRLQNPDAYNRPLSCVSSGCSVVSDATWRTSMANIVEVVRPKANGMCLECVKNSADIFLPCPGEH